MSISFYHYSEADGHATFGETEVNMSNANARMVMRHIGIETDECVGSIDAHDLKARCVTARAVGGNFDDGGFASTRDGNFIDCGVRPGYFADRVAQLEEVADEAISAGNSVTFA